MILATTFLLAVPSVAAGQIRTVERANMPRGIDSALRSGKLRIVDSTREATTIAPDARRVSLEKGQFLGARTGDSARTVLRPVSANIPKGPERRTIDTLAVLPFNLVGVAEDNRAVNLRPAVMRDLALRYQSSIGIFRGSFLIGLQDSLAPTITRNIGAPIPLTLSSDGNTSDSTAPRIVQVRHTNYPLQNVTVFASGARDSVGVRVITQSLGGTVIWLPVRAALVFDAPQRLSGLGIATASFPVRLIGASVKDSVPVTIAVDPGSVTASTVMIGPSGSAQVHLRSEGTGPARLTATSPGIDTATTAIQFIWPVGFVVFALLGGILGGAAKYMTRKGRGRMHPGKPILVGALIGLIVAVAYFAVNVSLLQLTVEVPFFNQAAIFALAMLGAFFGTRLPKVATV